MAYGSQQQFNYREDCPSLVEISISCEGLVKKSLLSKCNHLCVLSLQVGQSFRELGRTEIIIDNKNPVFQKTIITRYYFKEEQIVKFTVEDCDGLTKSDLQGYVIIRLAEIASTGQSATFNLNCNEKLAGKITLKAEEQPKSKQRARFHILCKNVDNKEFSVFGKSDPFLEIHKTIETGRPILVHKTEVIKDTLNPSWKPFEIDLTSLCSDDISIPISFTVYHCDSSSGSQDLIGTFETSFKEINPLMGGKKEFFLINKKKKGSIYKHSGIFVFSEINLIYAPPLSGQPPYQGSPNPGQSPYTGGPPGSYAPYSGQPAYPVPHLSGQPAYPVPPLSGQPAYPVPPLSGQPAYQGSPNPGQSPYTGGPPGSYAPYSGQPAYPVPPLSGQPAYPVPSLSGQPAYPVPPLSGQPAYPVPPLSGQPAYPVPPLSGQPAYPVPPLSGQPAYPVPPLSGQPAYPVPPLSGQPAYHGSPNPGQPAYQGSPNPGQSPYTGGPPGGYTPYSGQPSYPGAPSGGPNFSDVMNLFTGSRDAFLKASEKF